jgi:cobalt-zinc-cadmium efflux system membrane fusion protein
MKASIYIFILSLFFVFGCSSDKPQAANAEEAPHDDHIELSLAQFQNGKFKIEKPDSSRFYQSYKVTGMIDVPPENRASVNSFFSGFVSETHLLVGDVVQKGDLLIKLQNPDFIQMQQQFAQDVSELEFLASEFQRKQNLLKDKVIAEKVFQQTKSAYNSMKAKVQGQRKTLQLMNVNTKAVLKGNFTESISIYAPISGKIAKLNISQGTYVEPNTMIMEILNTEHIHLELDVFEKDIMAIKLGDTLDFKVPELTSETFSAYVQLIGAEVGQNRTVRVHAHPLKEEETFAVGMFVEASFKKDPQEHLSLPATAFAKSDQDWVVLKLQTQTDSTYVFDKIEVEDTKPQNGLRALKSSVPLSVKDQFLTQGVFDLVSGGGGGGHEH